MAIKSQDIDKAANLALSSAKVAQGLKKLSKRNSIMKMAEPGMYQYPLMTSNAIEIDVNCAIAKAYQLTLASAVCTAYSLNPVMYLKDYDEPTQYVQRFHSNKNVPTNFNVAGRALGMESDTSIDFEDVDVVEAVVNTNLPKDALESLAIRSWENTEDKLDTSSLNDMYRPYDRTSRILNEKVTTLKKANEALSDTFANLSNTADDINQTVNSRNSKNNTGFVTKLDKTDDDGVTWDYDLKTGLPKKEHNNNLHILKKSTNDMRYQNAVVRNNQLEALEPTMVNVQLLCHGNGSQFTQNLTLGVKVMPRVVQSDVLIASMVEASKNSHKIFKFLKWTKGEQKTLDFVLGITASKKKAIEKNAKIEVKTLNQAKKRKKRSNLFTRAVKNDVFPTLNIVITSFEAAKIKEITGVDLEDLKNAIRLMNEYFLLSFGIYDTEQNTLKVLFDSDDDWGYTSVGAMKSMMNKTTDLMNQTEVLRILGRR